MLGCSTKQNFSSSAKGCKRVCPASRQLYPEQSVEWAEGRAGRGGQLRPRPSAGPASVLLSVISSASSCRWRSAHPVGCAPSGDADEGRVLGGYEGESVAWDQHKGYRTRSLLRYSFFMNFIALGVGFLFGSWKHYLFSFWPGSYTASIGMQFRTLSKKKVRSHYKCPL